MSNYLKKPAAQVIAEAIGDANISPPEATRLAKAIMEALTEEGYESKEQSVEKGASRCRKASIGPRRQVSCLSLPMWRWKTQLSH
jgi:hypothetical protein